MAYGREGMIVDQHGNCRLKELVCNELLAWMMKVMMSDPTKIAVVLRALLTSKERSMDA
jgi:hypothetical protein